MTVKIPHDVDVDASLGVVVDAALVVVDVIAVVVDYAVSTVVVFDAIAVVVDYAVVVADVEHPTFVFNFELR